MSSAEGWTSANRRGMMSLMETMKVMRVREGAAGLALAPDTASVPSPAAQEVLVRVRAAGVTPTELGWHPTTHKPDGGKREEAVPAHEFSGIIEAVGPDLDGALKGREVFGMNDWFADGALADYCVAAATAIATKPASLSHPAAASVPISALTAWQGLNDRAKVRHGERVLIHGAAGAVGLYAVQMARRSGARVIATGSRKDGEFLRALGAEEFVDYASERFEGRAGGVDVVFDCVGGETLERSWAVLKNGGRLVTIASQSERDERAKAAFFIVEPKGEQLREIAGLIERGELKVFLGGVVKFNDAPGAYLGAAGKGRGKLVAEMSTGGGAVIS